MTRFFSLTFVVMTVTLAVAMPVTRPDIARRDDSDLLDVSNAHVHVDLLNAGKGYLPATTPSQAVQSGGSHQLLDLKDLTVSISALNSKRQPLIGAVDDDAVDLKGLHVDASALSHKKRLLGDSTLLKDTLGTVVPGLLGARKLPSFTQTSDNDLVDAKDAVVGVKVLPLARKLPSPPVACDNDLIDAKGAGVKVQALDGLIPLHLRRKLPSYAPVDDNDLVDAKGATIDVQALDGLLPLRRKLPSFVPASDNDLIDLKDLHIGVSALNGKLG